MLEEIKRDFSLIKILIILLIAALSIYLLEIVWQILSSFSDILLIIILSWLLSFILEPIVEKISKTLKLTKIWSTLITYLLFSSIFALTIFLLIPLITAQIQTLLKTAPLYLESAPKFLNRWVDSLLPYLENSLTIIPSVAQFFFSLFIIFIVSFYLIVDQEKINREIYSLIPQKWHLRLKFVQEVIGKSFSSFLRVQLTFGVISAITTWIVLTIFGIDFSALTSTLSGILAIIPLAGPFLSILPPLVISLISDPVKAVWVTIILLIIQQFTFNVVGPKLLGKAFRLHPVVVLISFLVGLKIAGGVGAIFAIPILGIAAVIIRELWHYFVNDKSLT